MHQGHVILGNWEDVSQQHGAELKGHRVEIRVLDDVKTKAQSKMIFEGMFPQLSEITDVDFEAAQWKSPKDNI